MLDLTNIDLCERAESVCKKALDAGLDIDYVKFARFLTGQTEDLDFVRPAKEN